MFIFRWALFDLIKRGLVSKGDVSKKAMDPLNGDHATNITRQLIIEEPFYIKMHLLQGRKHPLTMKS